MIVYKLIDGHRLSNDLEYKSAYKNYKNLYSKEPDVLEHIIIRNTPWGQEAVSLDDSEAIVKELQQWSDSFYQARKKEL